MGLTNLFLSSSGKSCPSTLKKVAENNIKMNSFFVIKSIVTRKISFKKKEICIDPEELININVFKRLIETSIYYKPFLPVFICDIFDILMKALPAC
jgi:hypothetical protein